MKKLYLIFLVLTFSMLTSSCFAQYRPSGFSVLAGEVDDNTDSITAHNLKINLNIDSISAHNLKINENIDSIAAHNLRINNSIPDGLEQVTENGQTGWRLIGADTAYYGNIGNNAVDFTVLTEASLLNGATGKGSFTANGSFVAVPLSDTLHIDQASSEEFEHYGVATTATIPTDVLTTTPYLAIYFNPSFESVLTTNGYELSYIVPIADFENGSPSYLYFDEPFVEPMADGLITWVGVDSIKLTSGYPSPEGNIASGINSTAFGLNTKAAGVASFTQGLTATALGDYSVILGGVNNTTSIDAVNSVVLGGESQDATLPNTVYAQNVMISTTPSLGNHAVTKTYLESRFNSLGLLPITEGGHTGWRLSGRDPLNYGDIGSSAIDFVTSNIASSTYGATGDNSFASGLKTSASGTLSFNHGYENTTSGSYSIAIGKNNTSSGDYALALGFVNSTLALKSAAVGGESNTAFSTATSGTILGGSSNSIRAVKSAIVGGDNNVVNEVATNSIILGGSYITATAANTVYTPKLNVNGNTIINGDEISIGNVSNATYLEVISGNEEIRLNAPYTTATGRFNVDQDEMDFAVTPDGYYLGIQNTWGIEGSEYETSITSIDEITLTAGTTKINGSTVKIGDYNGSINGTMLTVNNSSDRVQIGSEYTEETNIEVFGDMHIRPYLGKIISTSDLTLGDANSAENGTNINIDVVNDEITLTTEYLGLTSASTTSYLKSRMNEQGTFEFYGHDDTGDDFGQVSIIGTPEQGFTVVSKSAELTEWSRIDASQNNLDLTVKSATNESKVNIVPSKITLDSDFIFWGEEDVWGVYSKPTFTNITAPNSVSIGDLASINNGTFIDINSIDNVITLGAPTTVSGSIRISNDVTAASSANKGSLRYRADANNSYLEMCMQTGASTYAWIVIKTNTW